MANFTIDYNTSGEYQFDSAKVEVTGGLATLKDLRTANARLYNSFDVGKDANWTTGSISKTGTLNGSPTFSGGKMVCTGSQGVFHNTTSLAIETLKIKYTPNYTGSPPANINIIGISGGVGSTADRCLLTHSPSGDNFRITLNNSAGTQIYLAQTIGGNSINLQAGTEYELELNINSSTGTIRLFLNGVLHGTLTPGAWVRGGTNIRYTVGANVNIYNRAEGSFNDFIFFDNQQHTSGYTSGYSPSPTVYATDEPTIFKTAGDSLADIAEWNVFLETLGGSHQGTINYQLSEDGSTWKYWNGSAWVTAVGSQYNGVSVVNDNISDFPADADAIFVRAFLISDGDQVIQLDENQINFTINTAPSVNAGLNKTAIYNVATTPFSDAIISDDEDNITKAEYKLIDDVSWTNIPLGSFATFQEAVRNQSITFTHSGEKELQLRITDFYSEQVTDSLIVNVNRVNVTVNVTDEFGTDLPNVTFNPNDGLHFDTVYDSPFTIDYGIGTFTYTTTKNGYNDTSASVTHTIASTTLNITMTRKTRIDELQINLDYPLTFTLGDTFFIDGQVNEDLTNWKIRCEIYDLSGHQIRLATSNITGGGTDQIDIINLVSGEFLIKIAKDLTDNFDNKSFLEIELENPDGEKHTIWKDEISFEDEEIEWDLPDE